MNGRKAAAASRVAADPLQARPTAICTPSRSPMRLVARPRFLQGLSERGRGVRGHGGGDPAGGAGGRDPGDPDG